MPERTWEWVYYSGPTRGRHWTGGATSGRLPSAQSCAMFVIPHRPRLHATTLRRVGVADAGVHRSNRSPRQIGTERQLSSTHGWVGPGSKIGSWGCVSLQNRRKRIVGGATKQNSSTKQNCTSVSHSAVAWGHRSGRDRASGLTSRSFSYQRTATHAGQREKNDETAVSEFSSLVCNDCNSSV